MTGKERVMAALTFKDFDQIPIERKDCTGVPYTYPGWYKGERNVIGSYTDGWGCEWEALEPGVCGEVKKHPLGNNWESFDKFKPPYDILKKADFSKVEKACEDQKDKFISVQWEPPMPNVLIQ
jgi:hypothetical protein